MWEGPAELRALLRKWTTWNNTLHTIHIVYELLRMFHHDTRAFILMQSLLQQASEYEMGSNMLIGKKPQLCTRLRFTNVLAFDHLNAASVGENTVMSIMWWTSLITEILDYVASVRFRAASFFLPRAMDNWKWEQLQLKNAQTTSERTQIPTVEER